MLCNATSCCLMSGYASHIILLKRVSANSWSMRFLMSSQPTSLSNSALGFAKGGSISTFTLTLLFCSTVPDGWPKNGEPD